MITLSYGFEKPQTGDKGAVFFPALEGDIQKLNDHTHNGTNSSKLNASAITAVNQSVLSAAWVSLGGGYYRQLVTMPIGLTSNGGVYESFGMEFINTATGERLLLSVVKASSTTYYVYINDNTIDLTVVYS